MVLRCPKCGHRRAQSTEQTVCSTCGLVFAKWAQHVLGTEPARRAQPEADAESVSGSAIRRLVLPRAEQIDPMVLYGRCALYVAFVVWGLYFISLDMRSNDIGSSFMHRVNLVFHEAGHVVFMPFGHFMMVLGGTLGQLLMPVVAGGALLIKNRDAFGASLALWWLGQSLMDVAPYINDARALQLTLLGGGTGRDRPGMHDWENILLDLGLIEHERAIALAVERLGEGLLLVGLVWAALVLRSQFESLRRGERNG